MYDYNKDTLIETYRNSKSVREAAAVCSIPYNVAHRALANAGELDELLSDDKQKEIIRNYAQTQNVKQTARLFHVPVYTVSNVLRRHGISVESNKNTQTFGNSLPDSSISEILSLYGTGKTASEIAKETGFALQTIQKYLLRAGFADAKKSRKVLSAEDEYTLLKQIAAYYEANGNVEKTKKHFKVGRPTVHKACKQFGVPLKKRQRRMTEERKRRYLQIAETYSQVRNTEKTATICDCNIETVYVACTYYHVEVHKRKKLHQGDAVRVLSTEAGCKVGCSNLCARTTRNRYNYRIHCKVRQLNRKRNRGGAPLFLLFGGNYDNKKQKRKFSYHCKRSQTFSKH